MTVFRDGVVYGYTYRNNAYPKNECMAFFYTIKRNRDKQANNASRLEGPSGEVRLFEFNLNDISVDRTAIM